MGTLTKKQHICTNCKKSGHSIEMCWAKGGGKEGQGLKQKKRKQQNKRRKGSLRKTQLKKPQLKREMKALSHSSILTV